MGVLVGKGYSPERAYETVRLTVPQTNINGNWVSGFDPERLLTILNN